MKKIVGFVAAWLSFAGPAVAQISTTYQLTDSSFAIHQIHSFTCLTSLLCQAIVPTDFSGNPFGVSGNPFFVSPAVGATFPVSGAVSVSGNVGITGTLPAFASIPTFNCGSGCSGSGSSTITTWGSATLGNATAWGSAPTGNVIGVNANILNASLPVTGTFWPYTLGQQVSGSSVPVVLPAAQITTLTPPTSVTIFGPTAVGSANANPPVIIGGTVTGAAGQNVVGAAIKPASTAAVVTDTSVVTSENPNSALITAVNATTVAPSVAPATATNPAVVVDLRPDSPGLNPLGPAAVSNSIPHISSSQYPANNVTTTPTPLVAKGSGTTAAVTGTLTPASTATAYVCGFTFSAIGGTANPGPLVLSGILNGPFTYQMAPNSATIAQNYTQTFSPCLPASAVNTAIVMTTTAAAAATATDVNIWGYGL